MFPTVGKKGTQQPEPLKDEPCDFLCNSMKRNLFLSEFLESLLNLTLKNKPKRAQAQAPSTLLDCQTHFKLRMSPSLGLTKTTAVDTDLDRDK